MEKINIITIIDHLNTSKDDIFNDEMDEVYNQIVINSFFSRGMDTIRHAQEMNKVVGIISNRQHFLFYLNSIPKKKRYYKKVDAKKTELIELIQKFFNFSRQKAITAIDILTEEELKEIIIRSQNSLGGKQ